MPKDRDGVKSKRKESRSTHSRKGSPAKKVKAVNRETGERKGKKYRTPSY